MTNAIEKLRKENAEDDKRKTPAGWPERPGATQRSRPAGCARVDDLCGDRGRPELRVLVPDRAPPECFGGWVRNGRGVLHHLSRQCG